MMKIAVLTAPNGRIIDVAGPYPGSKSDGEIMSHFFWCHMAVWLNAGDSLMVDRGFSRSVDIRSTITLIHPKDNNGRQVAPDIGLESWCNEVPMGGRGSEHVP